MDISVTRLLLIKNCKLLTKIILSTYHIYVVIPTGLLLVSLSDDAFLAKLLFTGQ